MKSNKYLTIGLLTGFIVGGCIGVLAWAFLQNLFAISICAGIGMLIGIVIGADRPLPEPGGRGGPAGPDG